MLDFHCWRAKIICHVIRVEPARIVMMQCARRGYEEGRSDGQILFSARRWGHNSGRSDYVCGITREKIPNEEENVYRSKWDQETQKVKGGKNNMKPEIEEKSLC